MTQQTPPLVSVIIPVHNAEQTLAETIESALHQTHDQIEVLLYDDGSTDQSRNIIHSYQETDSRVQFLDGPKLSHPGAVRNRLMAAAKGDYIAFLDSDDLWVKTKLADQLKAISGKSSWSLCHTGSHEFTGALPNTLDSPIPLSNCRSAFAQEALDDADGYEKLFIRKTAIATPSVLFHRSLLKRIKGFRESPHFRVAEDLDFFCRALKVAPPIFLPKGYLYIRKHEANISSGHEIWKSVFAFIRSAEIIGLAGQSLIKKAKGGAWILRGQEEIKSHNPNWRLSLSKASQQSGFAKGMILNIIAVLPTSLAKLILLR